jgi:hypothetical protein
VKHPVAKDAGGVEHDVQPAELVARLLHHCQTVLKFCDRAMFGAASPPAALI